MLGGKQDYIVLLRKCTGKADAAFVNKTLSLELGAMTSQSFCRLQGQMLFDDIRAIIQARNQKAAT